MRAATKWLRARLCTGSLVFVFCVVVWFALSASYNSLHRDPGVGNEGEDQLDQSRFVGDRRNNGRSKDNMAYGEDEEDVQICKYPIVDHSGSQMATNDVWKKDLEPETCDGRVENVFHIENDVLLTHENALVGKRLDRCKYRGIEWATDFKFAYTEVLIGRSNAPLDVKINHDFVHVQCHITHEASIRHHDANEKSLKTEDADEGQEDGGGQMKDPRSNRHHGLRKRDLRANDSDHRQFQYHDVKDFHRAVVHSNAPRLYGSIGIPDLSDSLLSQKRSNAPKAQQSPESRHLLAAKANQLGLDLDSGNEETDPTKSAEEEEDLHSSNDERKAEDSLSGTQVRRRPGDPNIDRDSGNFGSPTFDQFLVHVSESSEVKEAAMEQASSSKGFQMNVLILALDSMSRSSFEENFKESNRFLKTELKTTVMNGYNSIGDAATAFVIPLITGFKEVEVAEIKRSGDHGRYVDLLSFIWNRYEQSGYVSLFAEDKPDLGTFQTHFYGFEDVPVHHYMRPFWLAVSESQLNSKSQPNCLGSNPKHKYMFDYMADFFNKYNSIPKFAFGFLSEFNKTRLIDEDLKSFLDLLRKGGHLENTLLVIVADHGTSYGDDRSTVAGKFEENLPYLSLTFPTGFREKHGKLMDNLRENSNRLTTAFDVHATLTSLLDVNSIKIPVNATSRAVSLLQEIPWQRTCTSASIDMHWCSCVKYERVNSLKLNGRANDEDSLAASRAVDYINKLIKNEDREGQCAKLTLDVVQDFRVIFANEYVLELENKLLADQMEVFNFSSRFPLFVRYHQVVFKTSPSDAIFEATIDSSSAPTPISVSRINAYGRQSDCVVRSHPDLRKYCHCIRPDA